MSWISKDDLATLIKAEKVKDYLGDKLAFLPIAEDEEVEDMKLACRVTKIVLIVVAVLGVLGAAAYGVYRFINRDYDDDFDDEFDDFDDDFYDDIDELDEFED